MPAPGAEVTIDKPVLLDVDVAVAGLTIAPGGALAFDAAASHTLEASGNIVVGGLLDLRPASAAVVHTLRFVGVNEGGFVGGGMEPVASDVGLWVMDAGRLVVEGSDKTAWTNAAGAVPAAANSIIVNDATGWQVGDEITITPTAAGSTSESDYDNATITAVAGNTITLSTATANEHPALDIPANAGQAAYRATAEVLNLTRNVRIEGGTEANRAHIFVRNNVPVVHTLRNAALRHLGPRQGAPGSSEVILGRYGLHFHLNGDNNAGSVVSGVVGRDIGSHVFVPHESNGISFVNNISHDTFDEAYWWDGAPNTRTAGSPTDNTLYENNVASLAQSDPSFRGFRLSGFSIGRGEGNVARGNVAVGIQGNVTSSGFIWPEGSEGIWNFTDNVAHNNATHGIFTWQNTSNQHVIERFTAYHNEGYGIAHGAYSNNYRYQFCTLYGNGEGAVELHAVSSGPSQLTFSGMTMDGAGRSDYLVATAEHLPDASTSIATLISNSTFLGYNRAAVASLSAGGGTAPDVLDLVDNTYSGNEFWIDDGVLPASRIRVQDSVHGSIELSPAGQGGAFNADWNADTRSVPPS